MYDTDHPHKAARGAFKAGAPFQNMIARQRVNDATETARTKHERVDGVDRAAVVVFTSVPSDEVPQDLFDEIADEYGLTAVSVEEQYNDTAKIVYVSSEVVD